MMIRAPLTFAALLLAAPALAQNAGEQAYAGDCSACHQATGQGVKGAFPALAANPMVTGDPAAVIGVVLNGRAAMPSFKADLSDAEVAEVVSYIRGAWGNKATPVTASDVAAIRAKP